MEAFSDDDEDDPVVQELDIYCCNGLLPDVAKLYLLQSPLRPKWRPYDLEEATKVQFKPGAGKLQIDIPVATEGPNVDPEADPALKRPFMRLTSTPVELGTSFALGKIVDGKLLLTPIAGALQLRPDLSHLDAAKGSSAAGVKRGAADLDDDDDDAKPQLQAVKVNVQRRETERQAEARLRSYSHHAKQQEEEPWLDLKLHSENSDATRSVWEKLASPPETELPATMTRQEYLAAITPGLGVLDDLAADQRPGGAANGSQAAGPSAGFGAPAANLPGADIKPAQQQLQAAVGRAGPSGMQKTIHPEALAALPAAMAQLFRRHSVADLNSIRQFLQTATDEAGKATPAAWAEDRVLQDAVAKVQNVAQIRGSFVQAKTGDEKADPLRAVIIDLLQNKEHVKKGDVTEAALAAGFKITDSIYNRVIKELCVSRGTFWKLKSGDAT